jgi:heme-degrading monooxygenase HmoA
MIIRFFRGIVHEGKEEEFQRLFVGTLLPLIRQQDGLISASVGLPHESSPREFSMESRWRDLDSIRKFTGENWGDPVIDPSEAHLIKEAFVHHYTATED